MNRLLYLLLIAVLLPGCTHSIYRTGYNIRKSDYRYCDVIMLKETTLADSVAVKIGKVKLRDSGISARCNEALALDIIRGEACAIDADLVVLYKERRPNLFSSCFRCNADFYRYRNRNTFHPETSDEAFRPSNVGERVRKDRMKQSAIITGSCGGGILLTFLLFSL